MEEGNMKDFFFLLEAYIFQFIFIFRIIKLRY